MEPMSIVFAVFYCMGIIASFQMFMPGVGQRQGRPPAWDKLKDAITAGGVVQARAVTPHGAKTKAVLKGGTPWPFRRRSQDDAEAAGVDASVRPHRMVQIGGGRKPPPPASGCNLPPSTDKLALLDEAGGNGGKSDAPKPDEEDVTYSMYCEPSTRCSERFEELRVNPGGRGEGFSDGLHAEVSCTRVMEASRRVRCHTSHW
jgi:hypothetical protein